MRDNGPKRPFYKSTSAQTLIAISFNTLSILAGGLISILTPQFASSPWILALFPPILTIRGGIGGILAGNLPQCSTWASYAPRSGATPPSSDSS